jgi:glycerol kinase
MGSQDLSWLVGELRALAGDLDTEAASPPLVIAVDQGGHASRAIAFDARGEALAEAFAPISTFRAGADRVEHDALEVVESVRTALADVHQSLGDEAHRVVAAGLATQRSSIACWDLRTNKPLSPILSWQDRRNAALVERLRERAASIRARTGLVLSPHYGASKLRWCLDHLDPVRAAAAAKRLGAGPLSAWLLRSLLGEHPHVVDPVNAARTQLLDLQTQAWSAELLESFGIAPELLPRVVPNRHAYGHLPFGQRSIPLIVCTGDQSAMPFAYGSPDERTIYLNVGTGAFLQRLSHGRVADGLVTSLLWMEQRDGAAAAVMHAVEGTVNGAASAIDWLNERVGIDTHRAAATMTRERAASFAPPLFINGVSGVGSPYWRANLEPRFIGEGNETARVIAVLESIAFLICKNVELMGEGAERILASGGLVASDYLCDCIATLSGLPVERTTLQESTATGLAYLIAGQPKDWQPQAKLERFTPVSDASLNRRFVRWSQEMEGGEEPQKNTKKKNK